MIDGQLLTKADPERFFGEIADQLRLQKVTREQLLPSYDGFIAVVRDLEKEARRLIIMIDEFDLITQNLNFELEFFNFLRSQATNHQVAYVLSTARELEALCHSDEVAGSPFLISSSVCT